MNIYRQLEANQNRRMAAQDRFLSRIESKEQAAESMIGDLMRDGKVVHYVMPKGGRYREGTKLDLVNFLIRNRYV